jgi:threonine aldolase
MTMQTIDLRSDTVSKPTPEMSDYIRSIDEDLVGDDVFGEDQYVNELQTYAAQLFGMEAALYCPSGTMTNQIAIHLHTGPGTEVICHEQSHVFLYEGGGIAANSGASSLLQYGNNGQFSAEAVLKAIRKEDVHFPRTKLVCIENTVNRGGGACWDMLEIENISTVCQSNQLAFHLDGARIFNAMVHKNESPLQYGKLFDSISICLSKGLGAPVGSLLLGKHDFIYNARRIRKRWGGGMRQAGYMAAAGLFALKNNIIRLKIDHERALLIANTLKSVRGLKAILPVETNIIIFEMENFDQVQSVLAHLKNNGIKANHIGDNRIRFVLHINLSDQDITRVCEVLTAF